MPTKFYYYKYKQLGLCTHCGKIKENNSRTECDSCRRRHKENYRIKVSIENLLLKEILKNE